MIKKRRSRRLGVRVSIAFLLVLALLSWWFVLAEDESGFSALFSEETRTNVSYFIDDLLGKGELLPAYRDPDRWREVMTLSLQTLKMSVLAIGIAGFLALITVIPAAKNVADGSLMLSSGWWSWTAFVLLRGAYILSRAVPELVWALLVVFVFSPGVLPGSIALGIHNFGVIGKLWAEVVEDVDLSPAKALRSTGGRPMQVLFYAVLPTVLPQFITYLLYRWEVVIRTTIVVGFVAAGGLGRQFRLSMAWFHLSDVLLLLICYVLLVFFVDLLSAGLRRLVH